MEIDGRYLRFSERWNQATKINGFHVDYYVDEDGKMIEFESHPRDADIVLQFLAHVESAHDVKLDAEWLVVRHRIGSFRRVDLSGFLS